MSDEKTNGAKVTFREVPADLVETSPDNGGLFHWVLASPALLFLAWIWVDLVAHYSPISVYWIDVVVGLALFVAIVVLPLGLGAYYVVSAAPRLFSHAGWDVMPLEPVGEAEQYLVRYRYRSRLRSANSWRQAWVRASQGWVYLEIAAILVGALVMIPVFFSVSDFGFGQ